jgi:predicted O-methyltransferase YrrM
MEGVPQHILSLLDRLHATSLDEESKLDLSLIADPSKTEEERKAVVRDKFVALDQDKAQYLYSLCRAIDARTIVEAGTSFGVSTIYLALAASANVAAAGGKGKKANVVATEYEPTKAAKAREYWAECGDVVTSAINLREGDLRETLKENLEDVDLLLLDSMLFQPLSILILILRMYTDFGLVWTPMALPTLKLVQPKMRHGAVVIADNTTRTKGYAEMLAYMRSPDSGFINMTVPFSNGLEFSVYLPKDKN